jgi:hypothetical protein
MDNCDDAKGVLKYDQRLAKSRAEEHRYVHHIGGCNDPAMFAAAAAIRPEIKKPFGRFSHSLTPGEVMTDDQWEDWCRKHLAGMGIDPDQHLYNIELHGIGMPHKDGDKRDGGTVECQHAHIVFSRISYSGEVWRGEFSQERAAKLTSTMEAEFNLVITEGWKHRSQTAISKPTKGEIEKAVRTKTMPPRMQIQKTIDQALHNGVCDWEHLAADLDDAGIDVTITRQSAGVTGCTFTHKESGLTFKGSSLGKEYSAKNIERRLHEQTATNRTITEPVSGQIQTSKNGGDTGDCTGSRTGGHQQGIQPPLSQAEARNSDGEKVGNIDTTGTRYSETGQTVNIGNDRTETSGAN